MYEYELQCVQYKSRLINQTHYNGQLFPFLIVSQRVLFTQTVGIRECSGIRRNTTNEMSWHARKHFNFSVLNKYVTGVVIACRIYSLLLNIAKQILFLSQFGLLQLQSIVGSFFDGRLKVNLAYIRY